MSRRERVAEALKREVSSIIHDELKDPRLGFITITAAEISADLRCAKVFFSVLGKEEQCKKTIEALESSMGFIRKLVGDRLQLRFTPEIIFREDKSTQQSIRIQELLEEIKKIDEPKKDN